MSQQAHLAHLRRSLTDTISAKNRAYTTTYSRGRGLPQEAVRGLVRGLLLYYSQPARRCGADAIHFDRLEMCLLTWIEAQALRWCALRLEPRAPRPAARRTRRLLRQALRPDPRRASLHPRPRRHLRRRLSLRNFPSPQEQRNPPAGAGSVGPYADVKHHVPVQAEGATMSSATRSPMRLMSLLKQMAKRWALPSPACSLRNENTGMYISGQKIFKWYRSSIGTLPTKSEPLSKPSPTETDSSKS